MFNDEEMGQVTDAVHRMVHRAIALDGTCTGEHGVGLGKKKYLVEELGEGTVALMRTVKQAIDPDNLFNPGKVSSGLDCVVYGLTRLVVCGPGRQVGNMRNDVGRLMREWRTFFCSWTTTCARS